VIRSPPPVALGGITELANLAEIAGCVLAEILDHSFDIL
jgi:hypothetical protein